MIDSTVGVKHSSFTVWFLIFNLSSVLTTWRRLHDSSSWVIRQHFLLPLLMHTSKIIVGKLSSAVVVSVFPASLVNLVVWAMHISSSVRLVLQDQPLVHALIKGHFGILDITVGQLAFLPVSYLWCSILCYEFSWSLVLSFLPASSILWTISVDHSSFTVWLILFDRASVFITWWALLVFWDLSICK